MTADHVLERLRDGMAVITPADRSDVVLAVASAHAAEGFPALACIILNGGYQLHASIAALVAGLRLRLPIITTELGTYDAAGAAAAARGRLTATVAAQDRYRTGIDGPLRRYGRPAWRSSPFRSRPWSRRKCLPIACSSRRVRTASTSFSPKATTIGSSNPPGRLLQHGIADLTILGDEAQIRLRSAELGVDLSGAKVIDPRATELRDHFAEQYAELRKAKGVTARAGA